MRYSLIIPHFNDSGRLERLLRTVPVSRADIEVIVVDDCSPDQSALEFLNARRPTIRWLSTRKNSGAGAARNVGLARARGDYIVFADSDDEFLPGAFDVFDEHVGAQDELVFFLAEGIQEVDGSPSNRADRMNDLCWAYHDTPSRATFERLALGHVNPYAKIYSRQSIVARRVAFEETRVSNDVAFNVLAAIQATKVRVVPVPIYRVVRRAHGLTADPNPDAFLERVKVQARLARSLKRFNIQEQQSATGWILASFAYGPVAVYKTFWICLRSDLRIDVSKFFQVSRWRQFVRNWSAHQAEKRRSK